MSARLRASQGFNQVIANSAPGTVGGTVKSSVVVGVYYAIRVVANDYDRTGVGDTIYSTTALS